MKGMIGINPDFDYLYDPQQARPIGFCTCCGGVIYREGICLRCERRAVPDGDE